MELAKRKQELRLDINPDAEIAIITDLSIIAELYGIARPSPPILKIMAQDIISTYPFLTSKEIITAFRLASQDKIQVSLNLYGKPLNAFLINQILISYCKYRNKIRAAQIEQKMLLERKNEVRNVGQCPKDVSDAFSKMVKDTSKKLKL